MRIINVFTSTSPKRYIDSKVVRTVLQNNALDGQEAFCNKRSHGTKSAILEGKLIIIPALGH